MWEVLCVLIGLAIGIGTAFLLIYAIHGEWNDAAVSWKLLIKAHPEYAGWLNEVRHSGLHHEAAASMLRERQRFEAASKLWASA